MRARAKQSEERGRTIQEVEAQREEKQDEDVVTYTNSTSLNQRDIGRPKWSGAAVQ